MLFVLLMFVPVFVVLIDAGISALCARKAKSFQSN